MYEQILEYMLRERQVLCCPLTVVLNIKTDEQWELETIKLMRPASSG